MAAAAMAAATGFASRRALALPQNVFLAMDTAKAEARAAGLTVIDLSIGSSDLLPPASAIAALKRALDDPQGYGYGLYASTLPLRMAVVDWFERRFATSIERDEVLALIGSQEGLAHALLAITDPGDLVLAPDPAYPSYFGAFALAGVEPYFMALEEHNSFLPDLAAIPSDMAAKAKAIVVSYPNNPTAAVATLAFWQQLLAFAEQHNLVIIHDFPYSEMTFGDYLAPSLLQIPTAKARTIELYSCSKSYHMAGLRIGFAVGGRELIALLAAVKGPVDFNQYQGIQQAAIAALALDIDTVRAGMDVFRQRRDVLLAAMARHGWDAPVPAASMYVWARLPAGWQDSFGFCSALCRATGVALSPGRAYGLRGEGWLRLALVREPAVLEEAVAKIADFVAHTT
jgi:aspartate/methionine/tyrosine aminotransferase